MSNAARQLERRLERGDTPDGARQDGEASGARRRMPRLDAAALHRLLAVTVLGFASGLPLALTGQAMQAWLSVAGVDVATIGFLSLVGLPYTFKFLWAPLMDRFELPWLGRRRGWLVVTQLLLAGALAWMASTSPTGAVRSFALLACLVAFVSASQDVVVDAYRTDLLTAHERGLGSSLTVLGYRLAMILSGGIALIWVDASQGGGWSWPEVYRFMAWVMVGLAVFSATLLPRLAHAPRPASVARHDILGFLAVVAAVTVGFLVSERLGPPLARWLLAAPLTALGLSPQLQASWTDLVALLLGIAFTLPLAAWAARAAKFETLLGGLRSYFVQPGAAAFLAFIVLYKLGDAFAGSLMTPFLLQAMQYSTAEVGVVNKVIGLWLTIAGALIGGALMLRLGLWRALLAFGVLQMASNLGFWWLAVNGRGVLPGITIPAFDWGFVKLVQATPVDGGLLMVIAAENLSGGMGTAAFVAFLMSLCNQRFSATQFALLSAFASIGRVWVGPLAGVLAQSIGWPAFFVTSTVAALPALVLLWWLRVPVRLLEFDPNAAPPADD
jgi:PAT family beta-lactamase induction signal transducer AmpG